MKTFVFTDKAEKEKQDVFIGVNSEKVSSDVSGLLRLNSRSACSKSQMEQDKRLRREIANSNERRRMQSINAGFQSLRSRLPQHEGEKLSKASILQHTAEYIYQLEQEKTRLLTQNCHLKRLLQKQSFAQDECSEILPKRKKGRSCVMLNMITNLLDVSSEYVQLQYDIAVNQSGVRFDEIKRDELQELRTQLENEKRRRILLEEKLQPFTDNKEICIQHHNELKRRHSNLEEKSSETFVISPENVQSHHLHSIIEAKEQDFVALNASSADSLTQENSDPNSRTVYVANTSRQNLETIVEAIKHLEGDHLFGDESVMHEEVVDPESQDSPLELTTRTDVLPMIQSNAENSVKSFATSTFVGNRPGVIVVKQEI